MARLLNLASGMSCTIAKEYATKRYRSNLINWGMLPLLADKNDFNVGDYVYIKDVKNLIASGAKEFKATVIGQTKKDITLKMDALTDAEKQIILKGCLINYYKG